MVHHQKYGHVDWLGRIATIPCNNRVLYMDCLPHNSSHTLQEMEECRQHVHGRRLLYNGHRRWLTSTAACGHMRHIQRLSFSIADEQLRDAEPIGFGGCAKELSTRRHRRRLHDTRRAATATTTLAPTQGTEFARAVDSQHFSPGIKLFHFRTVCCRETEKKEATTGKPCVRRTRCVRSTFLNDLP
jgi:hypothetical protein